MFFENPKNATSYVFFELAFQKKWKNVNQEFQVSQP